MYEGVCPAFYVHSREDAGCRRQTRELPEYAKAHPFICSNLPDVHSAVKSRISIFSQLAGIPPNVLYL